MSDAKIADAQVKIKEVLLPVIDNYLRVNNAMLTTGLAVDGTSEVDWSQGGKHITRVEFAGGLSAKRLNPDAPNDSQNISYVSKKYPLIDSIIPVQSNGTSLMDAFDNEGVLNRMSRHLQVEINNDLDSTLLSYTANIGDGSTNYGATGTTLSLDITGDTVKTVTYDTLVQARAKFGDSPGRLIGMFHSKVMTDILMTTEAKNVQQGIAIGNQIGIYFPTLGIIGLMSDRMPVTVGTPNTYVSLLGKPGCMSYAWRLPLDVQPFYKGNYVFQWDFVWRFAIMRNPQNSREMCVKIVSE